MSDEVVQPVERVLTFPADALDALGRFQGALAGEDVDRYLKVILEPLHLAYVDRPWAETDVSLKQIIPYCVLRQGNTIFTYRRTKSGNESRLHDKLSVGVGGHINPEDGQPGEESYLRAFARELTEEVRISPDDILSSEVIGLLNDDSDEVGKVHFGIVHLINVRWGAKLTFEDPALADGEWQHLLELKRGPFNLENWSRLVVDRLL